MLASACHLVQRGGRSRRLLEGWREHGSRRQPELGSRRGVATETSVLVQEQGGLGWLTLNRPKALNALNLDMIRILEPQLRRWREGGGVKLVVIR